SPVIFVFIAGLQSARNQISDSATFQNIEAMNKRKVYQRFYLPVSVSVRSYFHDFCLFGIVRRVKFMCCKKLSVCSRYLYHCHNSTRFFPDNFFLISFHIEKKTFIYFLSRNKEMLFPFIKKRRN